MSVAEMVFGRTTIALVAVALVSFSAAQEPSASQPADDEIVTSFGPVPSMEELLAWCPETVSASALFEKVESIEVDSRSASSYERLSEEFEKRLAEGSFADSLDRLEKLRSEA